MSSLYQINEDILQCIDMDTGEIIDEDKFNALQLEKTEKLENIALYYKNLLAEAEALKNEKNNFAERERIVRNKAESLKRYLQTSLSGKKFSTTRVNVSYRKSTIVEVDMDKLPSDYIREVVTHTVDKTEIRELLKAGEQIEGAALVEKNNIQVK